MTAPDFLPLLSRGGHDDPSKGACVMEYVSMLAGEEFTDHPTCTHPVLAAAARQLNDYLPDDQRYLLVPLIGRLFGTGDFSDIKVTVSLAQWCAAYATNVANRGGGAYATTYANAAAYAATVANAACGADATTYANAATANAGTAAYAAANAAATATAPVCDVTFLTKLIDEYDRLTGRTEHADFAEELPKVAELVGTNG